MRYVLQFKPLDGRYDGVDDTVSDGSQCRFRNEIGEEEGFPGGTWPSGGVDTHAKIEEEWRNETLPLSYDGVVKALRLRESLPREFRDVEINHEYTSERCAYRIKEYK